MYSKIISIGLVVKYHAKQGINTERPQPAQLFKSSGVRHLLFTQFIFINIYSSTFNFFFNLNFRKIQEESAHFKRNVIISFQIWRQRPLPQHHCILSPPHIRNPSHSSIPRGNMLFLIKLSIDLVLRFFYTPAHLKLGVSEDKMKTNSICTS